MRYSYWYHLLDVFAWLHTHRKEYFSSEHYNRDVRHLPGLLSKAHCYGLLASLETLTDTSQISSYGVVDLNHVRFIREALMDALMVAVVDDNIASSEVNNTTSQQGRYRELSVGRGLTGGMSMDGGNILASEYLGGSQLFF